MSRAVYQPVSAMWHLNTLTITIRDLDGPMSVTNDAEVVVSELYDRYFEPDRPDMEIVIKYIDTEGVKHGLLHDKGKFTGFDLRENQ